ncbi:hypothetical protein [Klebsiella variicola]|uniref:hypothetical protein n=1 Tax=Klebsiella variicola TaxID=244366 RepID=UPI0034DED4A8
MEINEKGELTGVNKDTGRDAKGRFAAGNSLAPKKRKPREITQQLREFAAGNKVTEKAVKQLMNIVDNKDGRSSPSDIIRASDLLLKTFNITVSQDVQNQHEEEVAKTSGEMLDNILNKLTK